MLEDPNDEPQYGERIPYVIIRGEPGSRLVDRAVAPRELFRDGCVHQSRVGYHHLTQHSATNDWMQHTTSRVC